MVFLRKFIVSGNSMSPTLKSGKTILASSLPYLFTNPKKGDVIICKDPRNGRILIKRIAKAGKNSYFAYGDNQYESTDSRQFGPISRRAIVGKVIYTL